MGGALSAGGRMGIGVWVLAIGLMDLSLEQAIVVPALPALQATYSASAASVTWVLTGFLLASAISVPLAGRLGDRHGKRLVLICSLGFFVIGSVVCAVADSIGVVIAGRVLQGFGSGVGPLAVALVRDHLPPERVARGVGILVGLAGAGGVVGFLACGLLVEYVSVDAIFWFLAAVALACLTATLLTVQESPIRARRRMDWSGAGLLGAALVTLLYAITKSNQWGWGSARVLGLFAASVALMAAFWARERTASDPLLDPRGLATRPVLSANLAVFAVGYALLVAYAIVPLIAGLPETTGYGLGLTTIQLSLVLAPSAVGALCGGLVSARLVSVLGARHTVALGAGMGLVAYAGFVALSETTLEILLAMIPVGFGTGLSIAAIVDLLVLSADREETGVSTALNSVIRAVGAALGAQIAVAIFTAGRQLAPGVPAESGITDAFVMALTACALAVAAALLIPHRRADPVFSLSNERAEASA